MAKSLQYSNLHWSDRCADEDVQVLVCKRAGDEVGSWLDGLFTDGLCTAEAIGKLLWQLSLKVSEGDISLQLQ